MTTIEIVEKLNYYCDKINCDKSKLPNITGYFYNSETHLRINYDDSVSILYDDKDGVNEIFKTSNLDELLIKLFDGITMWMAIDEMVKKEIPDNIKDQRKTWFKIQEDLFEKLNPDWAIIIKEKHRHLLGIPTEEIKELRTKYSKQLELEGLDWWDAWVKACEKYK